MIFLLLVVLVLGFTSSPSITVYSPAAYQVFQRNESGVGTITIRGRVENFPLPYNIEAQWDGEWVGVATSTTQDFQGWLPDAAAGQHTLEVRLTESPDTVTTVDYVGIGDVFALGGQSNAVGQGRSNQIYSNATLKAGLYTLGGVWKELKDPVSVGAGADPLYEVNPATGSMWPLVATDLLAARNVPIAFIPCASNGQGAYSWQPVILGGIYDPNTLLGACVNRIQWVGGAAGVLWVGGEENVKLRTSARTYADSMEAVAAAFWDCCQVRVYLSYIQRIDHTGHTEAAWAEVNAGVQLAIDESDAILPGADFREIETTLHFISGQQLQAAADAWSLALAGDE